MKKLIVLNANILIRAMLGNRVFGLLSTYGGQAGFFAPEVCYAEMRMHLPLIAEKRKLHFEPFASTIDKLTKVVETERGLSGSAHPKKSAKIRPIRLIRVLFCSHPTPVRGC